MTTNNTPASTLTWSDEMGSRSRRAWLLLLKGEQIVAFTGQNIQGTVVVRGTDYKKNGKWSHNTYRLELAQGVRAISGKDGWETGKFVEGLRSAVSGSGPIDRWPDLANALGVSVPAAMQFVRSWRPKAAEALDAVDVQLEALEEAAGAAAVTDTETIVVSFGSPTNRMIAAGWWKDPKAVPGHDGAQIALVDLEKGWYEGNIAVQGIVGTVISAVHASGMHGGYYSVTVAVVPGTVVAKPEPKAEEPVAMSVPTPEPMATPMMTQATMADLQAKFGSKRR